MKINRIGNLINFYLKGDVNTNINSYEQLMTNITLPEVNTQKAFLKMIV